MLYKAGEFKKDKFSTLSMLFPSELQAIYLIEAT